jgi:hypothetical protein
VSGTSTSAEDGECQESSDSDPPKKKAGDTILEKKMSSLETAKAEVIKELK